MHARLKSLPLRFIFSSLAIGSTALACGAAPSFHAGPVHTPADAQTPPTVRQPESFWDTTETHKKPPLANPSVSVKVDF